MLSCNKIIWKTTIKKIRLKELLIDSSNNAFCILDSALAYVSTEFITSPTIIYIEVHWTWTNYSEYAEGISGKEESGINVFLWMMT